MRKDVSLTYTLVNNIFFVNSYSTYQQLTDNGHINMILSNELEQPQMDVVTGNDDSIITIFLRILKSNNINYYILTSIINNYNKTISLKDFLINLEECLNNENFDSYVYLLLIEINKNLTLDNFLNFCNKLKEKQNNIDLNDLLTIFSTYFSKNKNPELNSLFIFLNDYLYLSKTNDNVNILYIFNYELYDFFNDFINTTFNDDNIIQYIFVKLIQIIKLINKENIKAYFQLIDNCTKNLNLEFFDDDTKNIFTFFEEICTINPNIKSAEAKKFFNYF